MKNNNLYINLTFIAIIICVFAYGAYFYSIGAQIQSNARQRANIALLFDETIKLDGEYSNRLGYTNLDKINISIGSIKKLIQNLEENLYAEETKEGKKNLEQIKKHFDDEIGIINHFIAEHIIFNNALRTLTEQYNQILAQTNNQMQLSNYYELYSMIIQRRLGMKIDDQVFANMLKEIKKDKYFDKHVTFVNSLQVAKNALNSVEFYFQQHEKNKFQEIVNIFYKEFLVHTNNVRFKLILNIFISICMILLFLMFLYIYIYKGRQINRELEQFQKAVRNSDNSVVITDKDHRIKYVNEAFEKTTGYKLEEVVGQTPVVLQSGVHDRIFYDDINELIHEGKSWTGEFVNKHKDGRIVYEKATIYPMFNDNNILDGYLAIKLNITEEKQRLTQLENKNMEILTKYQIDDTTGVWSRNVLNDELSSKILGYIIYLKVKNLNDIRFFYGNSAIQKIVVKIADYLKRFITLYKLSLQIMRVGEDDFALWYKHKKPSQDLLESIIKYIKSMVVEIDGTTFEIDIGLGVSSELDLPQADRLLQAMIAYMSSDKTHESYNYYSSSNPLELEYRHNHKTMKTIKNAITNNLIFVECQPIFYTNNTQKLFSSEILVRMRNEENQKLYPNSFLDVAKQSALYTEITKKVIEVAFRLIENYPDRHFSINLSIVDMEDASVSQTFLEHLVKSSYPYNLTVEILESEGISNYQIVRDFLKKIKEFGCKVSIDDFGSGYSNYMHILNLDIDYIKIDGSIVQELPKSKNAQIIVETIISLARQKDCEVIAEFVSNEEIYEQIKFYGIEYVQGFLFGRPEELEIYKGYV